MPYITGDRRMSIRHGELPKSAGELNYAITMMVQDFLHTNYMGESYTGYNEAIGVLECVKLELYRRQVSHYEDLKKIQNGDVYK